MEAPLQRIAVPFAVALLLALHWALGFGATLEKSNTSDEIAHLPAGYAYWTLGDYRLNPENGNLPQRLAALPLLFDDLRFPETAGEDWQKSDVWSVGRQFFFELGNDSDRMLRRARAAMALLAVPTGVLIFLWSRRLYGVSSAFTSLALFAFCPTFLAHGPLVTSDAAASLCFLLAVACTWWLLQGVTATRVVATGVAYGALALAKFSAPLVVPMALLLAAVRLCDPAPLPLRLGRRAVALRGRVRQAFATLAGGLAAAAIAFGLVWSAYGFRYAAFADGDPNAEFLPGWDWVAKHQQEKPRAAIDAVLAAQRHEILPEAYLFGFSHAYLRAQSRSAFLNGDYRKTGWVRFFPYAFAVKTPLAAFGIWLVAAAGLVASMRASRDGALRALGRSLYRTAPHWVLVVVYVAVSLDSRLNIGHRHLLPIYLPLYVLAGAAAAHVSWRTPRAWLVAALLAAFAAASLSVRPHYLAFFNALAGGPSQGYRHLVDSSLDWGQDLPGLARWLDGEGLSGSSDVPVYLSYFGTSSPEHYRIRAKRLPGYTLEPDPWPVEPLLGGVYCVSASNLQAVYLRDAAGPAWIPHHERRYQELAALVRGLDAARRDPFALQLLLAERGQEFWERALVAHARLRAGRLFAHLRQREPEASIGHSILIYRLDDAEVRRAVDPAEPPPELRDVPWAPPS